MFKRFGLDDLIKDIRTAVRNRNWFRCERLLRHLFVRLFAAEALTFLEKKLGKIVLRKLLVRLSAFGVPALGWLLLAAATIVAIIKNLERLDRAM